MKSHSTLRACRLLVVQAGAGRRQSTVGGRRRSRIWPLRKNARSDNYCLERQRKGLSVRSFGKPLPLGDVVVHELAKKLAALRRNFYGGAQVVPTGSGINSGGGSFAGEIDGPAEDAVSARF